MSRPSNRTISLIVAVAILAAASAVAFVLYRTKPKPKRASADAIVAAVRVVQVRRGDHPIQIHAQGTVIPARQVNISPQVSGRVTWKSPELVPGGRFRKGQVLLRIDPRDYAAALAQQEAQLQSRLLALQQEKSRRLIARKEWELFGGDAGAPDGGLDGGVALALREPQLEAALAALRAAKSMASKARLDLSRTTLTAPFDCIVEDEKVDVGQLVTPAARLGTLVGTDAFWVRVSIPVDQLGRVRLPQRPTKEKGSPVRIWQQTADGLIVRQGYVLRLYGSLDPMGRMARLLVEVPRPLDPPSEPLSTTGLGHEGRQVRLSRLPLLLGAYVHATIDAGVLHDVIRIPRIGLREGDLVYAVDAQSILHIRHADIVWKTRDYALLRSGLKPGERLVVSHLAAALDGMRVRVLGDAAPAAGNSSGAPASSGAPGASSVEANQ